MGGRPDDEGAGHDVRGERRTGGRTVGVHRRAVLKGWDLDLQAGPERLSVRFLLGLQPGARRRRKHEGTGQSGPRDGAKRAFERSQL